MSAFIAGFARGATQALDRAVQRKQFAQENFEKLKAATLPDLLERLSKRKTNIKNKLSMIDKMEDLGFSRNTALILHASGQLDTELARLEKVGPGKISTTYKKSLEDLANKFAQNNPNKFAEIFRIGMQEDPSGPNEEMAALMKVMEATTKEEFLEAASEISDMSIVDAMPSIAKFQYNPEKVLALTNTQRASTERQINNALAAMLEPGYFSSGIDAQGAYRIPKPGQTSQLSTDLIRTAMDIAQRTTGIHSEKNLPEAIQYILDRISPAFNQGMPINDAYTMTSNNITQLQRAILDPTYQFNWNRSIPRSATPPGLPTT